MGERGARTGRPAARGYFSGMHAEALANGPAVLEQRRTAGALTWAGPAALLFARTIFAVLAQGLTAAILALQGSAAPWRDAAQWFPLYATLIDAGCLALLWVWMRREGGRLVDLIGFDRAKLGRGVLLGLLLIAPADGARGPRPVLAHDRAVAGFLRA
jgi:hypothetical protein